MLVQRFQRGDRATADSSTSTLSVISSAQVDRVEPGAGDDLGDQAPAGRGGRPGAAERLTATSKRPASAPLGASRPPAGRPRSWTQRAERLDQPAVLGDRDELGRVEQAALGVVPAHQRLERRLIVAGAQADRPAGSAARSSSRVERVAQLAFDLEPAHRAAARISRVEQHEAAACRLPSRGTSRRRRRDQQLGVDLALGLQATATPTLTLTKCAAPVDRERQRERPRRSAVGDAPPRASSARSLASGSRTRRRRSGRRCRRAQAPAQPRRRPRAAARRRRGGRELSLISLKSSRSRKRIPTAGQAAARARAPRRGASRKRGGWAGR